MANIITLKNLRAALRVKYGSGNYRITRNGEIHAYGLMPNSCSVGWWFAGYTSIN